MRAGSQSWSSRWRAGAALAFKPPRLPPPRPPLRPSGRDRLQQRDLLQRWNARAGRFQRHLDHRLGDRGHPLPVRGGRLARRQLASRPAVRAPQRPARLKRRERPDGSSGSTGATGTTGATGPTGGNGYGGGGPTGGGGWAAVARPAGGAGAERSPATATAGATRRPRRPWPLAPRPRPRPRRVERRWRLGRVERQLRRPPAVRQLAPGAGSDGLLAEVLITPAGVAFGAIVLLPAVQ